MKPAQNTATFTTFVIIAAIAIFIVLFFVWTRYISPQLFKMPDNFSYSADVISKDNFYNEAAKEFQGEQVSVTKFSYEVKEKKDNNLIIKNIFDVKTTAGEKIFAVERLYGIDPKIGKHVKGVGDHDREGYLFAPRYLNKQPFTYWHINYDAPASLVFAREEDLFGLKVYRYETNYHADQTENLGFLPEVGESRGVNLDINLQVWVEPISGWMVKYQDKTTAYYYDLATKERLHPWNKFTNTYTEDSVREQVRNAAREKNKLTVIERDIPIMAGILIVVLISFLVIRRLSLPIASILFRRILLFTAFTIPVIITLSLASFAQQSIDQQLETKFENATKAVEEQILNRVEIYKNALEGGRGLFTASEIVERDEWKSYVEGVGIIKNYPGIEAMSVAEYIDNEAKLKVHIKRVRADGLESYTIWPVGNRVVYSPVTFIEPQTKENLTALGFDLWAEDNRKTVLETTRDSGLSAITGKIVLAQDTASGKNPAGFLMILPMYKNGELTSTLEERNKAISGFITAPFRMSDFMQGVFTTTTTTTTTTTSFEIFDGSEVKEDARMYGNIADSPQLTKTKIIYPLGHPWTIRFATLPGFKLNSFEYLVPNVIKIGGLIFSVLIFIVFYVLLNSRARAVTYANKVTEELQKEKISVEKRVSERTRELQEEQARLEASINSIRFGFILTDNTPEIITINSFAKHLLNQISTDAKVEKFSFGLEFNAKYSMDQIDKIFNLSFPIKSKTLESIEKKSPIEFKELELGGRIIHIFIAPIVIDEQGELKIIGTVILIEDITEEKILDRSKDEFFSIASHELRTPLTSIKGNSSMLKEYYADKVNDNTFKEMLSDIHESSLRLIDIVNDFLNVSRLEQGKIQFKKEKFDIALVITEAISELDGLALQKGLYLRMEKLNKASNPFTFADKVRTKEVIANLISNSIKYTQKGGIIVSLQIENEWVKISVTDTGRGISREQQNLLFRKFQQAGESILTRDTTKGTGLGLYISKLMIEGMEGKIYLEKSEVEKGSVFVFELPLAFS